MRLGILRVSGAVSPPRQLDLLGEEPGGAGRIDRSWSLLDERARGTRFVAIPVRSVLNTAASTRMGFWSLNPYVGCEFGCAYCYARDTHRYTVERAGAAAGPADPDGLDPADAFERRILVKTDAAAVLARTLDPRRLDGEPLVIGTATDPYQPAERRFRLTRGILEALLGWRGLELGIITKSPLVTRDLDLLGSLAGQHDLSVNISLATHDAALARRLEPRSPIPAARLRALRALTGAGIHAGLLMAPVIPGLTDSHAALDRLIGAAKAAGAAYVVGSPLRLGPASRSRFLPLLEREFPELVRRYRRHFGRGENVSRAYHDALAARIRAVKRTHGFEESSERGRDRRERERGERTREIASQQNTLW